MTLRLKSRKVLLIAGVVATLIIGAAVTSNLNGKIEQKQRDLQETSKRLEQVESEKFDADKANKEQIQRLEAEKQQLNSEKDKLHRELSAKRERVKLASAVSISKPASASPKSTSAGSPIMPVGGMLEAIKRCESGGNYQAQNKVSTASGAYQFVDGTWAGYGGYSKAKLAPPSVQDQKARETLARSGTSPWNASRACWS